MSTLFEDAANAADELKVERDMEKAKAKAIEESQVDPQAEAERHKHNKEEGMI
jgi:hypothetical protein